MINNDIILMKVVMILLSYMIIHKYDEKTLEICEFIKNKMKIPYNEITPNIVFTIGGDGTFIRACHRYPTATFFGIHTGHLGFYSNYSVEELDELIEQINNGNYKYEKIPLLSVQVIADKIYNYTALNEMTIISPPRTLKLDVYINDEFFEHFRGTGICISTPTGSTAYNKSLGGAVIDHNLKIMQLTEIAGINSSSYETINSPLVLGNGYVVELKAVGKYNNIFLTVDNLALELHSYKSLKAYMGNYFVKVGVNGKLNFINRIKRSFLDNNSSSQ